MLPSDIQLFTWIDVEDVLLRAQQAPFWPKELIWARGYWDGLTLGIRPGAVECIKRWLFDIFDPRFKRDTHSILLETGIQMPIYFEETEEQLVQTFTPSLARPTVITSQQSIPPAPFEETLPPVIVLHSFKGGVGRTLASIALARAITLHNDGEQVLLVDGDLEAPGITWLVQKRFSSGIPIALNDFLALVHSDTNPEADESIALTAERLQTLLLDNVYILPAFRNVEQFAGLEIKPEHLIQGSSDPYILTNILAKLGQKLNVKAVIVDLRAGLSELATGLLLDRRVYRVLVTTLSDQSLKGTFQLLQLLGNLSPSDQDQYPAPSVIITKILPDLLDTEIVRDAVDSLNEAAISFISTFPETKTELDCLLLEHQNDFVALPSNWEEIGTLLERHKVIERMQRLFFEWGPISSPATITQLQNESERQTIRRNLSELTEKLIFAETGDMDNFLTITSLRNLTSDFSTKTPIAVIVGAKGSGKTYTFLQIIRRKIWQKFVQDTLPYNVSKREVYVYPVLYSNNLRDAASTFTNAAYQETQQQLGLSVQNVISTVKDYLRNSLKEDLHTGEWRERWLDVIAWSAGFKIGEHTVGREFIEFLQEQQKTVVAIFDGLEDFFQTLNLQESIALRSLLQEVPEWLHQQLKRPLGLLVFVRQDMVTATVQQNSAQLLARYRPYSLRWNDEEVLRLVAWISNLANIPLNTQNRDLEQLSFEQLSDALIPLWGRKLGSEKSKEGRSAEWTIAALSDFKGQVQARDLVRLIHTAAKGSLSDKYWKDRILAPTEIRKAVEVCGIEKIEEITKENPKLGAILNKLKELTDDLKFAPFDREQTKLTPDDLNYLEDNGVILREEEMYYMSEIFRLGLGFKGASRGRNRVVQLSRRVKRYNNK